MSQIKCEAKLLCIFIFLICWLYTWGLRRLPSGRDARSLLQLQKLIKIKTATRNSKTPLIKNITKIKHNQWKAHSYEQIQKANSKKTSTQAWYSRSLSWVVVVSESDSNSQYDVFAPWVRWLATWFDKYIKASWESAHLPKGWSQDLEGSIIYCFAKNIWSDQNIWFAQRTWFAWFRFFIFLAWGRAKSFSIYRILLFLLKIFLCG